MSVEKIQVLLQSDKNNGTLHEEQYTFLIIFRSFLLRLRNVLDRSLGNTNTYILCFRQKFRKHQHIHFMLHKTFSEKHADYEIMS
jgi:hypothetical protein